VNDKDILNSLRRDILDAGYISKEGHIPSAYSILEIVYGFYKNLNKNKLIGVDEINLDKFVLSKGHGALALYAVLAEFGYFSRDWINNFASFNSDFGGHPDRLKVSGVEASTGSLGHGVAIAAGMAYAQKIRSTTARVFCLIGDGELNEGTIWETLLVASQHKLNNFIVIVDQNHSSDRAINPTSLTSKFDSFGFLTKEINGHNLDEVQGIYIESSSGGSPVAFIAETIKGKGLEEMENNPAWHHKFPNQVEYENFRGQLK
jgi:transketolase